MKAKTLIFMLAAFALGSVPATAEEGLEAPVPVRMVPPKFPSDMRREGTGGVVTVKCTIDEKGNVTDPVVEKASSWASLTMICHSTSSDMMTNGELRDCWRLRSRRDRSWPLSDWWLWAGIVRNRRCWPMG